MLILIFGKDTYRSKEKLHELIRAFREKHDPSGMNIVTLDAKTLSSAPLHEIISAAPFLAKKRLVVLKDIPAALGTIPESTVVIVYAREGEPKLKADHTYRFDELELKEVVEWIKREVQKRKMAIEPAAIMLLAQKVGPDLWRAHQELSKLEAMKTPESITKDDVAHEVQGQNEEQLFALIDTWVSGDMRGTTKLLHQELANGNHPLVLLSLLQRQLKILMEVKDGGKLSYHPFVIKKATAVSHRFSLEKLRELFAMTVEADSSIKHGMDPVTAITRLIFSVSSSSTSR